MRNTSSFAWTSLLAAGLAAITSSLYADDKPAPVDSDGYKMIPIVGADGKRTYIRVQGQPPANANLSSTGSGQKYDPSQLALNKTSSFANKSFSSASLYQGDVADESRDQRAFLTKTYSADNLSPANLSTQNFNTKAPYPVTQAYNRTAPGLDKSYPVNQAEAGQGKSATLTSGTSQYQNRTANLGTRKVDVYASPLAQKVYNGPETKLIQRDLSRMSQGLSDVKDLPNRPLTIDEVRDLINHGIKPAADAPPPPASKPLNDPDYQPDPAPPPLAPDDSAEGIPAPGAMAAQHQAVEPPPENSEPLPK